MTYLGDLVILLLGLYAIRRLTQVPVVLNVTVTATPPLPPNEDDSLSFDVPPSIVEYTNLESEDWAREARKRRAKKLFIKEKNWDSVLTILKQEDSN